jgi:hypothetical protein
VIYCLSWSRERPVYKRFLPITALMVFCALSAEAQQPTKLPRIGYVTGAGPKTANIVAFRRALRRPRKASRNSISAVNESTFPSRQLYSARNTGIHSLHPNWQSHDRLRDVGYSPPWHEADYGAAALGLESVVSVKKSAPFDRMQTILPPIGDVDSLISRVKHLS